MVNSLEALTSCLLLLPALLTLGELLNLSQLPSPFNQTNDGMKNQRAEAKIKRLRTVSGT